MNAYIGCVDDAADLIQLGIEKQENIRKGVDLMASQDQGISGGIEKDSDRRRKRWRFTKTIWMMRSKERTTR